MQHVLDFSSLHRNIMLSKTNLPEASIKHHKTASEQVSSRYLNKNYILPTSNICEWLFPLAVLSMRSHRESLPLSSFEEQMFLLINHALWHISDVHAILQWSTLARSPVLCNVLRESKISASNWSDSRTLTNRTTCWYTYIITTGFPVQKVIKLLIVLQHPKVIIFNQKKLKFIRFWFCAGSAQ